MIYAKYWRSFFFLLCTERRKIRAVSGGCIVENEDGVPSAIPLRKCSCPSLVAPSLKAIIPASTQTTATQGTVQLCTIASQTYHSPARSCAPLSSSVLRASSSKLTSEDVVIFREWISRIRARAVSLGRGNSIFLSKRPERRRAGSRISIRFVAAMTCADVKVKSDSLKTRAHAL